jgi:hypothetical protein
MAHSTHTARRRHADLRTQVDCAHRMLRRENSDENSDENRGFVWRSGAGTPGERLPGTIRALNKTCQTASQVVLEGVLGGYGQTQTFPDISARKRTISWERSPSPVAAQPAYPFP